MVLEDFFETFKKSIIYVGEVKIMRSFFYARVSSIDQSLERQLQAAREVGIAEEDIFVDKASGKDFQRPAYQLMKRMVREGDALYVKYPDRTGRTTTTIRH